MNKRPKYRIYRNSIQEIEVDKREIGEKEFEKMITPTKSNLWKVVAGTTLVSVVAGAVIGYCSRKGIPLGQGELEQALLTFGPAAAGTVAGMITMGEYAIKERKRVPSFGGIPYPGEIDAVSGIFVGAASNLVPGVVGEILGYGIGSLIGYITK